MEEIWKPIIDYNYYWISESGRVMSRQYNKERILRAGLSSKKYLSIVITKNKIPSSCKVHRLVATAFVPNPENKPQINHLDGNKLNNHYSNLEWCTAKENSRHSFDNKLQINPQGHLHPRSRAVYQIISDTEKILWGCIEDINRKLKIHRSQIWYACQDENRTAGGFKWRYA